jgi:predicted phage terminase large subunit-like protein
MNRTLKQKYSKKEFQERAEEILGRLFREVGGFAEDSEAERQKRRCRAEADHFYFFRTYLPHYFSQPEAPFHRELVELLDKRPAATEVLVPVVVAAPREFAKTSIASFGYVLHQICFSRRHFIILGSDTEDLASDLAGYIFLELLYNERISSDFGHLVRDNMAVDDFVTRNDIRVKARGRGQRLRGLKHQQWRPDLVVLDDLENDQMVLNPLLVRRLLRWVSGTVYPAIDAGGSLFWIGTVQGPRSALQTALLSGEEPWRHWNRRLYRALKEDGSSLWPERHPVEKLALQKAMMGSLAFNLEKMNQPQDEEGIFREEWLRFYQPSDLAGRELSVTGFFDPSLETGASADFKAVVIVGLDRREMIYYVVDAFIRKCSLDFTIAAIYERHARFGFYIFGVEDNLFQRLLLREFDRVAADRGYHLPLRGVTSKTAKETRISRLSALVERGLIRFCRGQGNQDLLLEQLLYFPSKTVHDDGPDALEGAIALQEGGAGLGLFEHLRREYEEQQPPAPAAARQQLPQPFPMGGRA